MGGREGREGKRNNIILLKALVFGSRRVNAKDDENNMYRRPGDAKPRSKVKASYGGQGGGGANTLQSLFGQPQLKCFQGLEENLTSMTERYRSGGIKEMWKRNQA